MSALSAHPAQAPAGLTRGSLLKLAVLAIAAAVLVGTSAQSAFAFSGRESWLAAFGVLSMVIGFAFGANASRDAAAPLALENARLEAELRRSRAAVDDAVAAEGQRLRRELHDRAQNRLVALQIRVGLATERVQDVAPEVAPLLAEIGDQAEAAGEELRRIARGIDPPLLGTRGLAEALRAEVAFCGIAVRIVAGPLGSTTRETGLAVYLCCLEAIQNAAKHGGRGVSVTVRLSRTADDLTFCVDDDGSGFDAAATDGSGLSGMRGRVAEAGGRLEIASARGQGTTVLGVVPCRRSSRRGDARISGAGETPGSWPPLPGSHSR
jgi:signal transduction histidine kinase